MASVIPDAVASRRLTVPEVPVRRATGRAGHLRVAYILDDFSAACFEPEADFFPLTMRDWRAELQASQPDLLLVESAWRGPRQKWWNEVSRCGVEIMGILAWCRERGIPTAFWNKEDPVHFSTFLTLASHFDAVFTTDVDCIPQYKAKLGHDRVYFLPFAAQPTMHNPSEVFERIEGTAFAGAYYERYPERTSDFVVLSRELSHFGEFHIYDRNYGQATPGYEFPDEWRPKIVGCLDPSDIAVAYKGYTQNLNVNSVKRSTSMFARRVHELMASNTLVVSNFAKGVRLQFGDLVIATDSPTELNRRMSDIAGEVNGLARLRMMALRRVLAEHTYAERLAYIAERAGCDLPPVVTARPLFVARCDTSQDMASVIATVARQDHHDFIVAVHGPGVPPRPLDKRIHRVSGWADIAVEMEQWGCTHLGGLDPRDWYGPHYVSDLLAALSWADVPTAGFAEYWEGAGSEAVLRGAGREWKLQDGLAFTRSLCSPEFSSELVSRETQPDMCSGLAMAAAAGYCRNGTALTMRELAAVMDLPIQTGKSLKWIQDFADGLPVRWMSEAQKGLDFDIDLLLAEAPSSAQLHLRDNLGKVELVSDLAVGQHQYLWCMAVSPETLQSPEGYLTFEASMGLGVQLWLLYFDDQNARIGQAAWQPGESKELNLPEGTAQIKIGLRASGPGVCTLERISPTRKEPDPRPIGLRHDTLIVSNIYPSYDNLYRNGFVHGRVRSYREADLGVDVFCLDDRQTKPDYREFEGIDVATGDARTLAETLKSGQVKHVLVHFLSPAMWHCLQLAGDSIQDTTIWVHGAEVQPWWRRIFNYANNDELEKAKDQSRARLDFWQRVFSGLMDNVHFVFVSQYFANEVFEDVGVSLSNYRYSIVHNPIDTGIFSYQPKPVEQCKKILSIRPYASRKYANDLSVAAIVELSQRPGFRELEFALYGDGPLFEEITAPLAGLENVSLHRRFLTHAEISELHKQYGIFLTPTRMDAQGVSRDEAMSSGLVPVTSAVTAIPEFVDHETGILAPGDDSHELAEGIWALAHDPERFQQMSRAAAERVRRQCASSVIVPREMGIFLRH